MNFLLDTCIIVWLIEGSYEKIPSSFRSDLENPDNTLYTSIISIWELLIKAQKNNMELHVKALLNILSQNDITIISLRLSHIQKLESLPMHHKDPFDRLIIAQSIAENMKILTADRLFSLYLV